MARLKLTLLLLLALVAGMALWHRYKPLPDGLSYRAPLRPVTDLQLLTDHTWETTDGQRQMQQGIFDEYFRLIEQAEQLVIVDMFLFNDFQGASGPPHRALSQQLTQALLEKRRQAPDMPMVVITDPINTLYGGLTSDPLQSLRNAGITVVTTDLPRLRDANPSWSGLWRLCCQWLGNNAQGGGLPNPMGEGRITLRSYLTLLNFKANHRKTLIVDEGSRWTGLVTSANAHDASSAHSNVGLRFSGPAVADLMASEQAVMRLSGVEPPSLPDSLRASGNENSEADARLQVLTEGAIADTLLQTIRQSRAGETLDIAVFYFSHRPLIKALKAAHQRGVTVRVLLDPNKDAFGRQKNGIPNRPVAAELHQAGLPVRWCHTQGEQCHSKMLLYRGQQQASLILGSANYTRRNLDDLNLESSVHLRSQPGHAVFQQASSAFARRWENRNGEIHSTDYSVHADETSWKYGLYRVMEFTGWSSF